MRETIYLLLLLFLLSQGKIYSQEANHSNVPGVVVAHSPKSSGKYLGTPSIVILKNGDYLMSHDFFGPSCTSDIVHIYRSKDKGKTWQFVTEIENVFWAGLFTIENDIYLLGVNGAERDLSIWKSVDRGQSWSSASTLRDGQFHGSSTPVVVHNGRIYKGYDRIGAGTKRWMSTTKSFIMSAPISSDLMNPNNWTYSNEFVKPVYVDGTGWLETNAVVGPDSKIKGVMRVANESGMSAGFYSLLTDNLIDFSSIGSINFIGGATKFNIMWDKKTEKYWSLTNYPPDTLRVPKMRAGGMRSVLSLISSTDLKEWKLNKIVLASNDVEKVGFQYVDWAFDGKDIILMSRTGFDDGIGGADNAHNSNYMTFHRISNYVTAKTEKEYLYLLPIKK